MEAGSEFVYVFWQYAYGLFKLLRDFGGFMTTKLSDLVGDIDPFFAPLLSNILDKTPIGQMTFATLFIGAGLTFIVIYKLVKFFTDIVL